MLEQCFLHLPGVGPAFCARLAQAGIRTWAEALERPLPCGPAKAEALRRELGLSQERLAAGDACWFGDRLTPAEQWRLFPHFRHKAAYVDIETTGLSRDDDVITTIALYDGERVRTYVRGANLEAFADDILPYTLLITWNGRGFDAPLLRRGLRIPLDTSGCMAHLDLLPVYRKLGLRGGLKGVEQALGIDREELDGVDGWAAVRLWREYERNGDKRVLETLLAYNAADVLSLEYLAGQAVARLGTPLADMPDRVRYELNPCRPDRGVLRRLLGR